MVQELEQWASEKGYRYAALETSIHFVTARRLYKTSGFSLIPNYPPYTELMESVSMNKEPALYNR